MTNTKWMNRLLFMVLAEGSKRHLFSFKNMFSTLKASSDSSQSPHHLMINHWWDYLIHENLRRMDRQINLSRIDELDDLNGRILFGTLLKDVDFSYSERGDWFLFLDDIRAHFNYKWNNDHDDANDWNDDNDNEDWNMGEREDDEPSIPLEAIINGNRPEVQLNVDPYLAIDAEGLIFQEGDARNALVLFCDGSGTDVIDDWIKFYYRMPVPSGLMASYL